MSVVDDTGELRRIVAHEMTRTNRPNRTRPVDVALIAVICAAGLALLLWMPLVVAPREYPVEAWRFMLTLASAVTAATPGLAGMYVLNRSNQRRHDATIERLERIEAKVSTYWNGYTAGVSDITGGAKVVPLNGSRQG